MINEILCDAGRKLSDAGIESAQLDSELLLAYVLGCERVDLYLDRKRKIEADKAARFASLIERRAKREPVAYILGLAEFWSRKIKVTPDVLIPRPETEGIVELALKTVDGKQTPLSILDLCTGSGCVAAALAAELPDAEITVTDISPSAIEVAKENLAFAGDRITFCTGDLFGPLHDPRFDLITANPPYIPDQDFAGLEPEITKYEPIRALKAGPDGLAFSTRILKDAPALLKPGGVLIMEIGKDQAGTLKDEALKTGSFKKVDAVKDYSGIERYIVARL